MPPFHPDESRAILDVLCDAAQTGGRIALDFFRHGAQTSARIDYKPGGSPVTEADIAVDRHLHARLTAAFPDAAWLSEETADDLRRLDFSQVIVVDPIDGTRAFTAGDPQWAVSIALVEDGRPVAGVVFVPAAEALFEAALGGGARLNGAAISVSTRDVLADARLSGPPGFVAPFVRRTGVDLVPKIPSLACRFASVASGEIDAAIASPDAHDWDIAGVDLILHEAGGILTASNGLTRVYNRRVPRHPTLYAAGPRLHPALLAAGRQTLGSGV